MKILPVAAIRQADAYTITYEPIASTDLMERAARACYGWFHANISRQKKIAIVCGMGNNGGDGLALARMLILAGYSVKTLVVSHAKQFSADAQINLDRLKKIGHAPEIIGNKADFKKIVFADVVVDALLGSGLSKPLEGLLADIVNAMNLAPSLKVAIDIPTGLFADDNRDNPLTDVFRADHTLTFQCPKLAFLLPITGDFVGAFVVLNIGLHPKFIDEVETNYFYTTQVEADKIVISRKKFDHKGTFGHALIVAGSKGKMGAAVLASKAALRAGCGLLTAHVPSIGYHILQTAVPEAMVSADQEMDSISHIKPDVKFDAVGIGPGIDKGSFTTRALLYFFIENSVPLVVDADALNILSVQNGWGQLPENSILTPHPGEFERMVGAWQNPEEMLEKARHFAQKNKMVLVLKGAHTAICLPSGHVYFNGSGSPALATPGSGDVLTGILTALLAQGYSAHDAAILGVYIHGKAGEYAAQKRGVESVIAQDLVEEINF
jgi:NAD(P)H-hydrate epimerase